MAPRAADAQLLHAYTMGFVFAAREDALRVCRGGGVGATRMAFGMRRLAVSLLSPADLGWTRNGAGGRIARGPYCTEAILHEGRTARWPYCTDGHIARWPCCMVAMLHGGHIAQVGHSEDAIKLMQSMCVAKLDEST